MTDTERDWHVRFDPDSEGELCYALTEEAATDQRSKGFAVHHESECRREAGSGA